MTDEVERFALGIAGVVAGCAAFQVAEFASDFRELSGAIVAYNLIRLGVQFLAFCVLVWALLLAATAAFVGPLGRSSARHSFFLSTLFVTLIVIALNFGSVFGSWINDTGTYPALRNVLVAFAGWCFYKGLKVYTDAPSPSSNRAD